MLTLFVSKSTFFLWKSELKQQIVVRGERKQSEMRKLILFIYVLDFFCSSYFQIVLFNSEWCALMLCCFIPSVFLFTFHWHNRQGRKETSLIFVHEISLSAVYIWIVFLYGKSQQVCGVWEWCLVGRRSLKSIKPLCVVCSLFTLWLCFVVNSD